MSESGVIQHEMMLQTRRTKEQIGPGRREVAVEALLGAALIAASLLLHQFAPAGHWAPVWEIALVVGGYALLAAVGFDLGAGQTSPAELMLVPMLFLAPPAYAPLLVAAAYLVSRTVQLLYTREGHPLRLLIAIPDAWPAFGPAVVLAAAGAPAAALHRWPILLAALVAQLAGDVASSAARVWLIHGDRPSLPVRMMGYVAAVDVALAPVGLLLTMAMIHTAAAIVCIVPLVGLLAMLSRERDARIRQALQLSSAYRGTALLMGDMLEDDDAYTGGEHTQGVVTLSLQVGRDLGLDPVELRDLEFGSLLHDIGKLRISNEIINKLGRLTREEWEVIRRHPVDGQQMLERVGGAMEQVGAIVRAHHERVDGGGYPDGLVGDEIPLAARIICVCDAYNAMTTTRSYRKAMPRPEAVAELRHCSGVQFDPRVVESVIRLTGGEPALAADIAA